VVEDKPPTPEFQDFNPEIVEDENDDDEGVRIQIEENGE